jgi:hypothetical protein
MAGAIRDFHFLRGHESRTAKLASA